MQLIRADVVWPKGKFGDRIKVAVIDTGIAAHPNLHIYGGANFVAGISSYADDNGHGTHCAGIIAGKGRNNVFGVAFGAHLYAVKVLDSNGNGFTSDILSGMNWCIQNRMQVISMSATTTTSWWFALQATASDPRFLGSMHRRTLLL
jgi:minor extracellular protease Epr